MRPGRSWYAAAKHPIEWVLAAFLLILTSPIMLVAALVVKLTSRGPIFYSQTRLGRNGRPFFIYKIRTMNDNCEKQSGICWSTKGDPRVTVVGRFLRVSHIDELPQLWNVLRGDMSMVGPRPERPEFFPELERQVPRYRERVDVRPGITGLAQVQLPPDTDIESVRRKLAQDLCYIENLSFWLDARILASTLLQVMGLPASVGRFLFALPTEKPLVPGRGRSEQDEPNKTQQALPSFQDFSPTANAATQLESA
jgi:lipopolysaccharide/colanic/teichoic acid biosynthesis glycosyltransferase